MDGSLTVGNFLSEGFFKKNVLNITGFFEGQIVALKSMDKIEPLQTRIIPMESILWLQHTSTSSAFQVERIIQRFHSPDSTQS